MLRLLLLSAMSLGAACTIEAENVTAGEYFFDTDPGEGSGTALTLIPGTDPLASAMETIDVSGLAAGPHVLFLRFQDEAGTWGHLIGQSFVGRASADYRINSIVSGEFFFDSDPGLDLGSPLDLSPLDAGALAVEGTNTVDVFALSEMFHTLSARVQDDFGMFSMNITQSLSTRDLDGDGFIDLVDAFPLDAMEWRDTDDDGIGNNSDPDIDGDGTANDSDTDDDGDGIPDADELMIGLDPADHVDGLFDTDRDGLTGFEEFLLGTDPNNPDTDGDSIVDGSDPTPGTLGILDEVPTPGGIDSGDLYGASVAVFGNLFVAGSPQDEGGGTVQVFRMEGASPVFEGALTIPEGFTAAEFGASVALEGDILVVGAPGTPPATKGNTLAPLQAAIFQRLGTGLWTFKQELTGQNANGADQFGNAVAIDGGKILVGAPSDAEDETQGAGSGAVYVYDFAGTTATLANKVKPPVPTPGEQFGAAVAASNGKFAVGSPNAMVGGMQTGVVNVFQEVGANLSNLGTMTGSQTGGNGQFGASVSFSGDTVAVGAPGEALDTGAVYTFSTGGGTVVQSGRIGADDTGTGDGFGASVSLEGGSLVVGAPGNNGTGALYRYDAANRVLCNKLAAVGNQTRFGSAVSISGDRIVIGAPNTLNSQGAVSLQRDVRVLFAAGFEN
ncbi:MAG: hypothetical protein R3200_12005 [Xanthomonadales bacterium]|nr:hypothetical protein [Xanthomonadales bacterium]